MNFLICIYVQFKTVSHLYGVLFNVLVFVNDVCVDIALHFLNYTYHVFTFGLLVNLCSIFQLGAETSRSQLCVNSDTLLLQEILWVWIKMAKRKLEELDSGEELNSTQSESDDSNCSNATGSSADVPISKGESLCFIIFILLPLTEIKKKKLQNSNRLKLNILSLFSQSLFFLFIFFNFKRVIS